MKLYDNAASPYAFKVRVTLYEKGIDFEHCELRFHSQREELLRLNPRGEVPALLDGDTALYDSKVICEYLEEKFPTPPLLPAEPAARARCRALELVADNQLDGCLYILGVVKFFRPELQGQFPEVAARAGEVLQKHYANLDDALGGRPYFVGVFSRADIAFMFHLATAGFMGHPVTKSTPQLARWVARMNERPSVQRAIGEASVAFQQSQQDADPIFTSQRIHWRSDRIEWAVRLGLGPWLLDEITAGRAFFSPVP